MDDRKSWELLYIVIDSLGVMIFAQLFGIMLPKRWWRGDPYMFGTAFMKLALTLFFLWLLFSDMVGIFDITGLEWLSDFPIRGLGLRLILLVPGAFLLAKFVR